TGFARSVMILSRNSCSAASSLATLRAISSCPAESLSRPPRTDASSCAIDWSCCRSEARSESGEFFGSVAGEPDGGTGGKFGCPPTQGPELADSDIGQPNCSWANPAMICLAVSPYDCQDKVTAMPIATAIRARDHPREARRFREDLPLPRGSVLVCAAD